MFKEISNIVGDSIPQWILYVMSIIIVILYAFIYAIDRLGLKTSKEVYRILFRKKGKLNRWKIRHHEFFEYIMFLLDYKIKNISFDNTVRDEIMKDFLKSYVGNLYDYHMSLLDEDLKKMKKEELRKLLKLTLYKAIENHENNFTLNQKEEDERKVAQTIIQKFNEIHCKTIEGQILSIDQIFENEALQRNNYELFYNILNLHHALIISLIINATKVFKNLNGDLSGLKYKGQIIEENNHHE